jgi:hypothetical protein
VVQLHGAGYSMHERKGSRINLRQAPCFPLRTKTCTPTDLVREVSHPSCLEEAEAKYEGTQTPGFAGHGNGV